MVDFIRKRLQVFVSSTFSDLIPERQAAVEAILTAGHIPAGMELFTSGDESQMDVIKQWIDESDVYLLILGGRYGSIEPKSGKSYTQLEYEYALSKEKPLFSCVIKDSALEIRVKAHGREVIETHEPQKLKEFRELVLSKMSRFWEDAKDIKIAIAEKEGAHESDAQPEPICFVVA
jgi:nucleoside 2-deoxyribosyltransferase